MVKVIFIETGKREEEVVDVKEPVWDNIKRLIKCEYLQIIQFGKYTIFMDEEGVYGPKSYNMVAQKWLSKLPIRFGTLDVNFVIAKLSYDEDGEENYEDIDITLSKFVKNSLS